MADVVPAALAVLTPDERQWIRLTQQARGEDKARVAAACGRMNFPVEFAEFFADLPARIASAHLVIGRAGASTVSEFAVIGRPSVLVPFPYALDQDQAANAAALAASGGAVVVPQDEFTPERLAAILRGASPSRRSSPRRPRRRSRSACPTPPSGWPTSCSRSPGRRRRHEHIRSHARGNCRPRTYRCGADWRIAIFSGRNPARFGQRLAPFSSRRKSPTIRRSSIECRCEKRLSLL